MRGQSLTPGQSFALVQVRYPVGNRDLAGEGGVGRRRGDMNFDYSDDQKFLKDEARKFLEAECGIAKVRAVLNDEAKSYDKELWGKIAGQVWLGAAIPEAHGGLGLGHIELCAIVEELGRVCAPVPFGSTVYF